MNSVDYIVERKKKEFWLLSLLKTIGYIALYMVTMTLFEFINEMRLYAISVREGWDNEVFTETARGQSYSVMIISALFTVLILIAMQVIFKKKPLRKTFHLNKISPLSALLAFITGISLNFALNVFMSFVPQKYLEEYSESMDTGNLPIAIYIIAAVICAPIIEELIFRNFATSALKRSMPVWLSVLITSTLFGLVHGQWIQMIYAGALGALLASVFCYSDSIFLSILIHFGFNSVSIINLIVDVEKMSENELMTFEIIYSIISWFCIFVASGAAVALFASIKHYNQKKKHKEAAALAIGGASGEINQTEQGPYGQ